MNKNKMYINGIWKANLAFLLSLFVFASYNNNVCACATEAVKTELLLSNTDTDILFSFDVSFDHNSFCLPKLFFEGKNNFEFISDCTHVNLLVKIRLDVFISFREDINSFWIIFNQSTYADEEDLLIV